MPARLAGKRFERIVTLIAGAAAAAAACLLPLVYFMQGHALLAHELRLKAQVKAELLGLIAARSPETWLLQDIRLRETLQREPLAAGGDQARIFGTDGRQAIEAGELQRAPIVTMHSIIFDAGRPAGTVEVSRSLRPLLRMTGGMALLGLLLAWLVFVAMRVLPLRALRAALARVAEAQDRLREANANLEERVRSRTADLESALKELESFSYSVAHDLRAPLRAIGGFSKIVIATEGERLSGEGRRRLAVVERNAVKMGALVDDLLTLARISRSEPLRERLDLSALSHAVIDDLLPQYPGARARVGALPPASGDPTLIRQVLANLVDNALKYSSRAAEPQVAVDWRPDHAAYCVRDNGVGFDVAYSGKLFRPFERLHDEADFPGHGIGLAIVKRVIERHGGRIWAEAAPGRGACFYFTLAA